MKTYENDHGQRSKKSETMLVKGPVKGFIEGGMTYLCRLTEKVLKV